MATNEERDKERPMRLAAERRRTWVDIVTDPYEAVLRRREEESKASQSSALS